MNGRQLLASHISKKTSQAKLARKAKCSESHLSLYLKGERDLSIPMAKRVHAATGGEVPLKALVPSDVAALFEAAE